MLRIENAVVSAMAEGDVNKALNLLHDLVVSDRRRGWWAVFRVAFAQRPDERRAATVALVGKFYIARRAGRLVGTSELDVLSALLTWVTTDGSDPIRCALSRQERLLLQHWLPGRLKAIANVPNIHP